MTFVPQIKKISFLLFLASFLFSCFPDAPPMQGLACSSDDDCSPLRCIEGKCLDSSQTQLSKESLPSEKTLLAEKEKKQSVEPLPDEGFSFPDEGFSSPDDASQLPEKECSPGIIESCYDGPPKTKNIGSCKGGRHFCQVNGTWSTCLEQVLPSKEICGDQIDNNCNGQVDENCECQEGETQSCYTGPAKTRQKGECQDGKQTCISGKWSKCQNSILPQKEICDGLDNDCDGQIDNNLTPPPCAKTKGICQGALQRCGGSQGWLPCTAQDYDQHNSVYETEETLCDGLDNDCDGQTDEGCQCKDGETQPCGLDTGECQKGTQTCSNGKWGPCKRGVKPTKELCDGLDNDCDGQTDEDFPKKGQKCTAGSGSCQREGIFVCSPNHQSLLCNAIPGHPKQEKCNNQDDDCNGKIDDKLTRPCYSANSKTKGKGVCHEGTQTCSNGKWSLCQGEVTPTPEICDGKDNDCNGKIDEDFPKKDQKCYAGLGICKREGIFVCSPNHQSLRCNAVPATPKKEICDGLDNDCDGTIDEGCMCITGQKRPCGLAVGECKKGTQTCSNGQWGPCQGGIKPTREICDGLDNDCNGQTDEGLTPHLCPKQQGVCKGARRTCLGSQGWSKCTDETYKKRNPHYQNSETKCDGRDNDCDGTVDEGCECITGRKRACYTGKTGCTRSGNQYHCQGSCKAGTQTCDERGRWGKCQREKKPTNETCNNQDDDCDGQIDENLTKTCYNGPAGTRNVGICQAGIKKCQNGRWSGCIGAVLPKTENCQNGKDDDCDAKIDAKDSDCHCQTGTKRSCYTGKTGCTRRSGGQFRCKGICEAGTQICSNSGIWGPCSHQILPKKEKCNNFLDDDCDGNVNEGCSTACIRRCNTDADCQNDPNCGNNYECKSKGGPSPTASGGNNKICQPKQGI